MEGLSLNDLSFDSSEEDIFDVFAEKQGLEISSSKDEEIKQEDIKIEHPNSEEKKEVSTPESVAKKEEDIQQVDKNPEVEKKEANSSSPTPNDTEQLYSSLAAEFKAKGILSNVDLEKEKISSMDDINAMLQKEVESRLSERHKVIEEASKAGVNISEAEQQVESIARLKDIPEDFINDDENIEFRMNVIAQDFINRGIDKERAISMAQRSVDAGDDINDAKIALKEIIKSEEAKLERLIESKREEETKALNDVKDFVHKEDEIIPGIKLTSTQKEELFKQITTSVEGNDSAFIKAQREDPVGSRVKLEAMFYLTKGLTDFSIFGKAKETKISRGIESLLRGASFTESGRVNTESRDDLSTFTLKDLEGVTFE